jgi:hypothetical protein
MLFLASPLVGMNVLVYQSNDLLAILPVCGAFLVWRRPARGFAPRRECVDERFGVTGRDGAPSGA